MESNQPPRLTPAMTPSVMPRIVSMAMAYSASRMVMGKAPAMRSMTGCPLNAFPKSRVNTPLR